MSFRLRTVPQPMVDPIVYLFTNLLDGRNSSPADGVHRALGREPARFHRLCQAEGRERRLEAGGLSG